MGCVKKSHRVISILSKVFVAFLLFTAVAAFAKDAEQSEWANHVRQIMKWGPEVSIRIQALGRETKAREGLRRQPDSREYKRDLADALHTQGHMAEEDGDFAKAMALHKESLRYFEESGLPSKESYDGVVHSKEHIFQVFYDSGEKDRAYDYSEKEHLAQTGAIQSDRFLPRYYDLIKERKVQAKELSWVAVQTIGHLCQAMLQPSEIGRLIKSIIKKAS